MGKRSCTSAHRDRGDEEEIAKEAEKEGREGEGRREEVPWKPIEERKKEALTGDCLSTFACVSSTLHLLSWHNYE